MASGPFFVAAPAVGHPARPTPPPRRLPFIGHDPMSIDTSDSADGLPPLPGTIRGRGSRPMPGHFC